MTKARSIDNWGLLAGTVVRSAYRLARALVRASARVAHWVDPPLRVRSTGDRYWRDDDD